MATNIYGNGTTTATAGANTIVHFYDRAGIKAANRTSVYSQFADRKSMPTKMGKTFKISRFEHMYDRSLNDADFAAKGFMTNRSLDALSAELNSSVALGEGATGVNKRSLQKVTFETTLARYGEMLDYTDEVDLFSEDYIQVKYREELGEMANSRYEDLIQIDMLATPTVLFAGTATAVTGIGASIATDGSEDADWKISYDLIRKGVRTLTRNRAKKNSSIVTGSTKIGTQPIAQAYYAIIGADVKADLETLTRGTVSANGMTEYVYVQAHKYADAASLAQGEVGAMHEVRFIESESALVETGADVPAGYVGELAYTGTVGVDAKFNAYPILFPTEGAFATIGLKGNEKIKFHSKSPMDVDSGNTFGTTGFFSYNFFYAGIILREEALLKISVAASA